MNIAKQDIVQCIDQFYTKTRQKNDRYQSWEHCYAVFYNARKQDPETRDYDLLCLHLAFYLASWGMYRGSSFLLQKDYLCHMEVVKEILKPQYDRLLGLDCSESSINDSVALLIQLKNIIVKLYSDVKKDVEIPRLQKGAISDTLVSKVLLGTLGCTPAYDRFFVATAKALGYGTRFTESSIRELSSYYRSHLKEFEPLQQKMQFAPGMPYPPMKILDMAFWEMGKQ